MEFLLLIIICRSRTMSPELDVASCGVHPRNQAWPEVGCVIHRNPKDLRDMDKEDATQAQGYFLLGIHFTATSRQINIVFIQALIATS
jgi:hypothetical protein